MQRDKSQTFLTQHNWLMDRTNQECYHETSEKSESGGNDYGQKNTKSPKKPVHDGVSPIHVPEQAGDEAFQSLWEYLVPPNGKAQTAQGELIRIAGRAQHEFLDNGCMIWDDDFRKMLDAFLQYHQLGNLFCCCAAMAPAKESVSRPPFISSSIALKDSFFHIIICIYLPSAIGMV